MKSKMIVVLPAILLLGCGGTREPQATPPGAETSTKTDILKTGAMMLQSNSPCHRWTSTSSAFIR
jgi:hypothetical protein